MSIYEIVLRSVFEEKMGKSSGPNIPLFKRFQEAWLGINVANFKTGMQDKGIRKKLKGTVKDTIEFALQNVQEDHSREDYREFLELTIIFLGSIPPRGLSFRVPGAFHHARWMAKAIYCMKIFLFRDEFPLTAEEDAAIRDVCIFLVRLYVKAWIISPISIEAPRQDFEFLQNLNACDKIDPNISRITVKKFCNHLWYLVPETAALAFFDDKVWTETKIRMIQALKWNDDFNDSIKRFSVQHNDFQNCMNKELEQFIFHSSCKFFKRFNISTNFLDKNPLLWKDDDNYKAGLEIAKHLKVVNDAAERGVKLMEDFNNLLTKNEAQKQFILQVVTDYRRQFSDCKRATLSTNM